LDDGAGAAGVKDVIPIHGGDHCPGGPDPIPCLSSKRPWIGLLGGDTAVDNTTQFALLDEADWDPALVTDADSGGDTYFQVDSHNQAGGDYWILTTKVEGWYTFEYIVSWTNVAGGAADGYALAFLDFNSNLNFPFGDLDSNNREAKDWVVGSVGALVASARLNIYRTIYVPANREWQPQVKQTSGADRDYGAHLKVWWEGMFGSTNGDNSTWVSVNA
jgi:hypothetical protein